MLSESNGALAGQALCLMTALIWAVALTLFRRPIVEYGARTINLFKCSISALLQGLTVVLLGQTGALWNASLTSQLFVVASGLVGLVLGDTALFGSVARLGVHRALLLQTLAPIFTAVIAAVWQSERIGALQGIGGLAILFGVGLVVAPQTGGKTGGASKAVRWAWAGVGLGVLAAFGQGAGLVLAKVGMLDLPVAAASFLRLAAAAVGMTLVSGGLATPMIRLLRTPAALKRVVPATLLGTYLALFLMMAGVALAPAAVAAVLLSTSPIFSLVLGAVRQRRWFSARELVGTLTAMAGVAVLTLA